MAAEHFHCTSTNPNDSVGGGGCMCYPNHGTETKGPFAVFTAVETDVNTSPHAVLCLGCAEAVVAKCKGELLAPGQGDVFEGSVEED